MPQTINRHLGIGKHPDHGTRPRAKQTDMPHSPRENMRDKITGYLAGERKCHCGCGEFGTRFRGGQLMCRTSARIHDSTANGQNAGRQDRTPPLRRRWL